jgi:calcineurin-like phosphoesterase family protein
MSHPPGHWLGLDTWVTSDQHWGHGNIRRYQGRPENHFELMRTLWEDRVGPEDDLLHLGDLVWGCGDDAPHWVEGLPGRKRLVRGNHDKCSAAWYRRYGFEVIGRGDRVVRRLHLEGGPVVAFSHLPLTGGLGWDARPQGDLGWDVNVHGHIHGNPLHYAIEGKAYANASVEATGFAPVRLRELLARAGAL